MVYEMAGSLSRDLKSVWAKNEATDEGSTLNFSISNREFSRISDYIHSEVGIQLTLAKKQMVASRLAKRLRDHGLSSYSEYFQLAMSGELPREKQIMLDLLTTNETYLFREPAHFDFLRDHILKDWGRGRLFNAWSAACSTGEEAYSLAIVAMEQLQNTPWEIFGSDVSTRVLALARKGLYSTDRISHVPPEYLDKYCLKGVRSMDGSLLINKQIRERAHFRQVNLNAALPEDIDRFDVIFLRNVLIYFNGPTRQQIVRRLLTKLKSGGYFFVSHTETISGISNQLESVAASVYRKK